ncbi:MAG: Ig-like domain-containing protein, partial [Candidatus Acidiferrales bacterium]
VNAPRNDAITIPATYGKLRFWRNTAIANLSGTSSYTTAAGYLGYEWDQELDNGSRPPGLIDLSSTTINVSPDYLLDYGANYGSGTATHNLTLYRAASGALVFGAGTVQWSWALDANHDYFSFTPPPIDSNFQQATVNLLADMGIQPATLQPGMIPALSSNDNAPPVSVITSPAADSNLQPGSTVTITGTAVDSGGGVVAGVEVSMNGGITWHRAAGLGNWSYVWTVGSSGTATILSRAVDDSLNLEKPSTEVPVTIGSTVLVSLAVTPANPLISSGTTEQFTATGTYSDNTTQDLTGTVAWTSTNTAVATIGSSGLANAVGGGTATIQATLGAVTGSTGLTVTTASLASIAVTPANPSIAKGLTQQFTATGTYSDNSTRNLTSSVTWTSGTTTTATITNAGLASALATGTTTIQAKSGAIDGSTVLTVTPPTLVSIAVTPANSSVLTGATLQYTATGIYSDNSSQNLTGSVTWTSTAPTVATISSAGLASG